jgi:hypothetical protein
MFKRGTRLYVWTKKWAGQFYPGWRSWVFFGLILSFLYLAISGFLFALFVPRGLHGLPLLFHVAAGGIFAVCLSMVVVWRAREYMLDDVQPLLLKLMFWTFFVSGLCLIVTSLSSMFSFLSMKFQLGMIGWHRYSALVSLVSVSIFLYFSLNREE